MRWLLATTCLIAMAPLASSSNGDQSMPYRLCTDECRRKHDCPTSFASFGWVQGACYRCRYECMWTIVKMFDEELDRVPQFHGKWPFAAFQGSLGLFDVVVQEPASVIFSLANFVTMYIMYIRITYVRTLPSRRLWQGYTIVGMLTWLCSTAFHTVDYSLTEYLDYFSACALVLYALCASAVLTVPWLSSKGAPLLLLIKLVLCFFYISHIKSMMEHFDYGYNMKCCVLASFCTTILYCCYLLRRYIRHSYLSESDKILVKMIVWANCSVLLELLDFSPIWWIFDPHSLFHLATVPLPLWFSNFLILQHREQTVEIFSKNV